MKTLYISFVAGSLIAVTGGVASAQMEPAGGSFDQPSQETPGLPFVTLDRMDSRSRVGVDASYLLLEGADFPDALYRFELYGQTVFSSTGANYLGGYGAFPMSFLSLDGADDTVAIGGLEGGAYYGMHLGQGDLVVRGGLVLPTADDDDGAFTNIISGLSRLTDFVQGEPRSLVLRTSASYVGQTDVLFFRLDGGLDLPLADFSDSFDIDRSPFIHLNAGAGIGNGEMAGLFELVNLIATDALDDGIDDAAIHILGLAFRGTSGSLGYHAGIYFGIDEGFGDFIDAIFSVGINGRI